VVVHRELARPGVTRDTFLRAHGVDPDRDRVYLHVAERKHDPAHPFAFLVTVARGHGSHGRMQHVPLADALREHADEPVLRQRLLAPLRRAAAASPGIRALIDSGEVYHPVAWTAAQAHALLRATADLQDSGLRIRVPDWWQKRSPSPQVRVELGATGPSQLGLGALLDFQMRYFLGEDELSPDEWRALMGGAAGLHLLRGKWVELDPARHAEALRHWQGIEAAADRGHISFADGMRLLAGLPRDSLSELTPAAWTVATPGPWLAHMLGELQSPSGSPETDPGPALHGTLRPYQRDGVAWLWLLIRLGLGGCLADDMGLGKTIQVIALLLLLRKHESPGPHLIVLPASLLGNWRAELARFGPDLRVHTAHRSVPDGDAPAADVDVVLTTYATLQRQAWLKDQAWGLVVLDEAQAIKNAQAKQTHAVKALHARHRLTCSPAPRSRTRWSTCGPCSTSAARVCSAPRPTSRSSRAASAPITPASPRCGPSSAPTSCAASRPTAASSPTSPTRPSCRSIAASPAGRPRSTPRPSTRSPARSRASRASAAAASSSPTSPASSRSAITPRITAATVNMSPRTAPSSCACRSSAPRSRRPARKCWYSPSSARSASRSPPCSRRASDAPASCSTAARRSLAAATWSANSSSDDGPPFMVLSLKAGGTGLNLTAAGHVVHFDRWWNPAVENQATDRAYRIGQHKNVLVHKFVCRGTLEEKIDAMLRDKQGLADGVLADEGERRLTELSTDELLRVVSLDLRAALADD
jgi:hypothetical protein